MILKSLVRAVFGSKQDRDIKKLQPIVTEVNEIFAELENISDDELRNKTHEFRKLLHAAPRYGRVGDQIVFYEQAEAVLNTHPDVQRTAFVGTRRDVNPGEIAAFIIANEGVEGSEDLANQIRGGMARLGPGYQPKCVFFVDRLPMKQDKRGRGRVDYNALFNAAEQLQDKPWRVATWDSLATELKDADVEPYDLEDLLPEAFAVVKEACRRHLGKKWMAAGGEIQWNAVPFDVQLMGATSLARGNISEMATGEGKTLTAIMPLYLHALTARGAHLVTVNDYLSRRDSEWNQPIFAMLGLLVGCLDKTQPNTAERRLQYAVDITYGTVNEFGFDYLRDNMARSRPQLVQRDHYFAIIDEVDSVLIDEARTPLIISGPVERPVDQYERILPLVKSLVQKQTTVVNELAREAEDLLEQAGDELPYDAGFRLLQCHKALPRHKRYMKLRNEPSYQRLQDRVEADLMTNKKMPEIEGDLYFLVDERQRQIELTDKGRLALSPDNPDYWVLSDIVDEFAQIEADEELSDEEKMERKREARERHDRKTEELHAISQVLHAFVLKTRDVDYVVEDNKVVIVDENTGRKMHGRRWSDGLHQAVEAKEGVKVEAETQTLAQITIQNYFRMYERLSGMTGTAETEAAEFHATYGMDVIVIPTNRPIARADMNDMVYRTKREKYAAVIEEVRRLNAMELPILIGTTSVQDSETLSKIFSQQGLQHAVLNAKNHAQEAEIVAKAGRPGAITIATNMAGRGTDIKLGEGVPVPHTDPETNEEWPGGLQIIGTERHESRRIDRQLRGRSGRQGDPGTSRFFVSLEDKLMLHFGSDRIAAWLEKLGMQEGEAIQSGLVTRSVEKAQQKVEAVHYDARQRTLQFDNVMNEQRKHVYGLRGDILKEEDIRQVMLGVFEDALDAEFSLVYGEKTNMGDSDVVGFITWVEGVIATESMEEMKKQSWPDYEELHDALMQHVAAAYDEKMAELGEIAGGFCRMIGLQTIDRDWQDHLLAVEELRNGIYMRSYGQKDPLVEFTKDATAMFEEFMLHVNKNIFTVFFRARPITEEEAQRREQMRQMLAKKAQLQGPSQQPEGEQPPQEAEARQKIGAKPLTPKQLKKAGKQ